MKDFSTESSISVMLDKELLPEINQDVQIFGSNIWCSWNILFAQADIVPDRDIKAQHFAQGSITYYLSNIGWGALVILLRRVK